MSLSDALYLVDTKGYRKFHFGMTGQYPALEADDVLFVHIRTDDLPVEFLHYKLCANAVTGETVGRIPYHYLTLITSEERNIAVNAILKLQRRVAMLDNHVEFLRRYIAQEHILNNAEAYAGNTWSRAYDAQRQIIEIVQEIAYDYDPASDTPLDIKAWVVENLNWIITGKREGT